VAYSWSKDADSKTLWRLATVRFDGERRTNRILAFERDHGLVNVVVGTGRRAFELDPFGVGGDESVAAVVRMHGRNRET
jgi:hypothetical protein